MSRQARLGAFVLVTILLLGFATGRVGKMNWFEQEANIVEAEFEDLYGLELLAQVRMAGVKVGIVQDTMLENNRAVISIALQPDVRLPASTRATIVSRGLVGEKYISLRARAGDSEWLPDGARIPTDPGGDINTFMSRVTKVATDLQALSRALTDILGSKDGTSKMQELLDNTNNSMQRLSDILQENRQDLRNVVSKLSTTGDALQQDLPDTLHAIRQITEKIGRILPDSVESGQEFFEHGKQTMQNVDMVIMDNRENLYRTLFELRKTAENLEELSDDLRRNPWKITVKKREVPPSPRTRQEKMEE
ncbi:MAG: MlaD family protein, partial [Mariprofundaceae bacterium]